MPSALVSTVASRVAFKGHPEGFSLGGSQAFVNVSDDGGRLEARGGTSGGARTGLFVPELRTLFVAVPARGKPAAIWALRVVGAG